MTGSPLSSRASLVLRRHAALLTLVLGFILVTSGQAFALAPGDTLSVVTLQANFNSDNPNAPPNTTLPGAPAGDNLVLTTQAGTINVVSSYDGLSRPVEIRQLNVPGMVALDAHPASTPAPAEKVTVSWSSVAKDDEAIILMDFAVRASNGATLASVEYLHQGQLSYNGFNGGGQLLPVLQRNKAAQQFTVVVDFLSRTTSLAIDGTPVAGFQAVPFAESGNDVAYLSCNGQGGHPQTMYVDNLSMFAFCRVPNGAPIVVAPASVTQSENSPIAFTVTASDPDGEAIASLTSSALPTGASFTPNLSNTSGSFAWTPDFTQSGSYSVTFTAANSLSASATTAITILNVDRARAVGAPSSVSGSENSPIAITVTASDPDGDAITSLTASPLPLGASFTPNLSNTSGSFAWTPDFMQSGSYSVTFTAANALSASATTSIAVANVDREPSVVSPVSVTGSEGSPISFTVTASDPDGEAIASLTASPLPAGSSFAADPGNTSGSLAWTPDFTQSGSYSVTFTAANALSASATTAFTILNVDLSPAVAGPSSVSGSEGSPISFTVSASDPDGDAIASLTTDALPTGASFTADPGNTGGTFAWTPTYTQAGTYPVTFTATAGGLSGSLLVSVSVGELDRAPEVSAPAAVDGEEGGILDFGITASDPDGDPVAGLTADLSALPAGNSAVYTEAPDHLSGSFHWPMKRGEAGAYDVTFTASNGLSGSAVTRVNVAFSGTSVTGEFIWTPQPGDEGTYIVTFTATNALNETGSASTTFIVRAPLSATSGTLGAARVDGRHASQAPERALKGPIVSVTGLSSPTTGTQTTVSATATDGGAALLAPSIRRVNGAASAVNASTGIISFDADLTGLPNGNNAVFIVDQDPVVTAPVSRTTDPGVFLGFTVGASDPDVEPMLGLAADLSVLPAGNTATFTANGSFTSGTFAWTPRPEDAGTYAVEFTGFNALVGKATTTITVRAVAPARIYTTGAKKIRLNSNRPQDCMQLEPVDSSFSLLDVDLTTIKMISNGTGSVSEIGINNTKSAVIGDRDNNLIQDLQICFNKGDIRAIFSNLRGSNSVPVVIKGRLYSGAYFQGSVTLEILAGSGVLQTAVAPNPLNPSGTLSFITRTPGAVRVALYDLNGRLVRTLMRQDAVEPGAHEISFEARDGNGRTLSSGVYFYRIESRDGVDTGRFTVLK